MFPRRAVEVEAAAEEEEEEEGGGSGVDTVNEPDQDCNRREAIGHHQVIRTVGMVGLVDRKPAAVGKLTQKGSCGTRRHNVVAPGQQRACGRNPCSLSRGYTRGGEGGWAWSWGCVFNETRV
ncbi:hypothetical protein GW17_00035949 [Ensete ventricosum]|nr:hypothetical protein GW17_00035949 [Ensete ventricosum]RZR87319.1 hypothetical protein BHM03_00014701 [Ensete ventricosum]